MHPPFFVVDHKVGPRAAHPHEDRPHVRRTRPERLQLTPAPPAPRDVASGPAAEPAPPHEAPSAPGGWLARLWRKPQRSPA